MRSRIVIFGAPGAGKGTQAALLSEYLGVTTLSTGSLFRAHMKAETELGKLAASFINDGDLVPDEVTTRMVWERLQDDDMQAGFILDGFPRTLPQAQALDELLGEERALEAALKLLVKADEMVERMLARGAAEHREDDTAEVILHRIEVYREKTRKLEEYYGERGIFIEVDAMGTIDEVHQRIISACGQD